MEHYGGLPQDIEWAYADGAFYLLQSRPATGVDFLWSEDLDPWQTVPEDDDTLWTAKWAEEVSGPVLSRHCSTPCAD